MGVMFPDYDNCIVNLANSILKYYGAETPNKTLELADGLLSKRYRNVAVILLDGMGTALIERHLKPDGFFRSNLAGNYSSVFPPTTTSSTTGFLSALYPNQTGWLGWTQYYPQIDKIVVPFTGNDAHGSYVGDPAWDYTPYRSIFDILEEHGTPAKLFAPFAEPHPDSFDALCALVKEFCEKSGGFVYAYWDNPDTLSHKEGASSPNVGECLSELEKKVCSLCGELSDALVIVTADHGHIDVDGKVITDYPEINDCLKMPPSFEPRALNLFVKDGCHERLERAFEDNFGNEFRLFTRKEALETGLFGKGEDHPLLPSLLGDHIAAAVGDIAVYNTKRKRDRYLGNHAGLTAEEMTIPLIAAEGGRK